MPEKKKGKRAVKINVYGDNLRSRVEVTKKTPEGSKTPQTPEGVPYFGIQFFIGTDFHHDPDDEDTSAVVFWYHNKFQRDELKAALVSALKLLEENKTDDEPATQC